MVASLKPFVIKLIDFGQAALCRELTQPLKIDTIHIFNQRVSMVNLSQTLIAARGHYPRSAHPAYAECGQGLEVWELQLWAYILHDCLQTDTCVSQMFVREKKRSWGHTKSKKSWKAQELFPYVRTVGAQRLPLQRPRRWRQPPFIRRRRWRLRRLYHSQRFCGPFFQWGFWQRYGCPWHGRNKDVRFFWLRESHEVFLLTLTSCHWYVLEDNRQQG